MPESSAELWEAYLPRLAAAKEQDRQDITRAFLPLVIPLGRFKIVPVTIERLLWLEEIKSPFITGKGSVTKLDVLSFLWICSPDFRVGMDHGKSFCRRHFLISWRKYAITILEYVQEMMSSLGADTDQASVDDGKPMQYDWLPVFVDGFASQYNWSEKEIMNIPIYRVGYYATAMAARMDWSGKKSAKFARHQDKVKKEYLRAANVAAREEAAAREED